MKNNVLEYKGYHTKVEYIAESNSLYGKIEGINDLVTFEADHLEDVEKEFHIAVDDYLAFCEDLGQVPEKEYKGSFNVRISPALHRQLAMIADKEDMSLNALIEKALTDYMEKSAAPRKEDTIRYASESVSQTAILVPFALNNGFKDGFLSYSKGRYAPQ